MSMTFTRKSAIAVCRQPDSNGGLSYGASLPRTVASSGSGSDTTVVSTALAANGDTDDDFVGWVFECTDATNTENIGLRRAIREADDSTSTYTTFPWPAATASGDVFALYQPPHGLAVLTASASSTVDFLVTRDRNETNNRWVGAAQEGGYYAVKVAADSASAGVCALVATSLASNNRLGFADAALGFHRYVGDHFELWKFPEVTGRLNLSAPPVRRDAIVGAFGRLASARGLRDGGGSLALDFRGPGAGREGLITEAHEFLECTMDASVSGGNSTLNSTPTTTNLSYSVGNHSVGQMVVTADGYAGIVSADSGSAYTVTPALPVAPATGGTVYGATTYTQSTGLNSAMTVHWWEGQEIPCYAWGCVPLISLSWSRGQFAKINANFNVSDWAVYGSSGTAQSRGWVAKTPTVAQVLVGAGRASVDGTELSMTQFAFDPGMSASMRENLNAPNGTDGYEITDGVATGSFTVLIGTDTAERALVDKFLAGKQVEAFFQMGHSPGLPGVLGVHCQRIRFSGNVTPSDNAGLTAIQFPFEVVYDASLTTLDQWSVGTS